MRRGSRGREEVRWDKRDGERMDGWDRWRCGRDVLDVLDVLDGDTPLRSRMKRNIYIVVMDITLVRSCFGLSW